MDRFVPEESHLLWLNFSLFAVFHSFSKDLFPESLLLTAWDTESVFSDHLFEFLFSLAYFFERNPCSCKSFFHHLVLQVHESVDLLCRSDFNTMFSRRLIFSFHYLFLIYSISTVSSLQLPGAQADSLTWPFVVLVLVISIYLWTVRHARLITEHSSTFSAC